MIEVEYKEENEALVLSVKGHAEAAEYGKDIVCSAASILAYTAAQNAQSMYEAHELKKKPNISLESGDTTVIMKPKKECLGEAIIRMDAILYGYVLLASSYPERVKYTVVRA